MANFKSILSVCFIVTVAFVFGYLVAIRLNTYPFEILLINRAINKPLEKYAIQNLSSTDFPKGEFKTTGLFENSDDYTAQKFDFAFVADPTSKEFKHISGLINIPKINDVNKYPLIILVRGYIDQDNYSTGEGSLNIGRFLASNGFVTVAPDFLGYANSDLESSNIFETRFQTYTTVVSLIKSIEKGVLNPYWDGKNILIWGHSNGGQIALTSLEITGGDYPTTLWAPVSKPFPYSILYYTDESDDKGKLLRSELAKFEKLYDVDKYSLTNYLDRINSPIQLHQGTNDDAVPVDWSDSLYKRLKNLGKDIDYITHPGSDHNMYPDWNSSAKQTLDFFKNHVK